MRNILRDDLSDSFALCLISQLPLFELHKKWLLQLYEIYTLNITNCLFPNYNIEFYISLIFHYLPYSIDMQNEVSIVYKDSKANIKELMRYRNYNEIGINLPNFTFQKLLETIEPIHIIYLVKLILLERNIIFVRTNCSDNTIIIESLLQLICPLYFFNYS